MKPTASAVSILFGTLITTLICVSWILPISVEAQGKTCNLKEVDLCLTNFYYDQKGLPQNDKQFRKTCSSMRTLHKCLSAYMDRCMSQPVRETFVLLLNSVINPYLDLCSKPVGDEMRIELYKHAKCISANSKQIGTCGEELGGKDAIFFMLESGYKRQVPSICCNLRRLTECTHRKTVEHCGVEAADFQKKMYKFTQSLVEFCADFDPNTAACENNFVPTGWKSSEDPKSPLARMINAFF